MLENTLGGSKERAEETERPHLSLVTHSCTGGDGTLLSAVCPAAVKTREVELEICHMPPCHPALEMRRSRWSEVLFSFISGLLVHSCEHTHADISCVCTVLPLFLVCTSRTFKGLSMPLSANKANLSRNYRGEVMFPRWINKLAADCQCRLVNAVSFMRHFVLTCTLSNHPIGVVAACFPPGLYRSSPLCADPHLPAALRNLLMVLSNRLQTVLQRNWSWICVYCSLIQHTDKMSRYSCNDNPGIAPAAILLAHKVTQRP